MSMYLMLCHGEEKMCLFSLQDVIYLLWFNFILSSNFIFLCFKIIIIHYNTQKQKKIKFEPRIKVNHNRSIVVFQATYLKGSVPNPWFYEEHWKVCNFTLYFWSVNYIVITMHYCKSLKMCLFSLTEVFFNT